MVRRNTPLPYSRRHEAEPTTRIAAFVAGLAAVFAAAALAGAEINPDVDQSAGVHDEGANGMDAPAAAEPGHADAALPPGLAVAQDGYRLVPDAASAPARRGVEYRFLIADSEGATVRSFDEEHERRMHLIVVGRDFSAFQHLHPSSSPTAPGRPGWT